MNRFDFDDIMFFGVNTKPVEKIMKEQVFDSMASGMTENEKKACMLGIDNTLSIMKQYLNESIGDETIVFYHPDTDIPTEFSAEEVLDWVGSL